jgi:hypothetical protein
LIGFDGLGKCENERIRREQGGRGGGAIPQDAAFLVHTSKHRVRGDHVVLLDSLDNWVQACPYTKGALAPIKSVPSSSTYTKLKIKIMNKKE